MSGEDDEEEEEKLTMEEEVYSGPNTASFPWNNINITNFKNKHKNNTKSNTKEEEEEIEAKREKRPVDVCSNATGCNCVFVVLLFTWV